MFGALEDYKSKSFYEKHKNIQFDTLTEQAEYEIVAVFKTVAYKMCIRDRSAAQEILSAAYSVAECSSA